jgi:hypothetical protein
MEAKQPPWIGGATMVEDSPYILVTKFGIAILAPKVVAENFDSAILAHMLASEEPYYKKN